MKLLTYNTEQYFNALKKPFKTSLIIIYLNKILIYEAQTIENTKIS